MINLNTEITNFVFFTISSFLRPCYDQRMPVLEKASNNLNIGIEFFDGIYCSYKSMLIGGPWYCY